MSVNLLPVPALAGEQMEAQMTRTTPIPRGRSASISVDALLSRILSGEELAVIDAREEGVRARDGYLLVSVSLPLGWVELRATELLPRLSAPVVIYDDAGGELAERTRHRLEEIGYQDVAVLHGGLAAWRAAGLEVFHDAGAVSKGFGEFIEREYGTPHLTAREVKERVDAGEDLLIIDSRTLPEFAERSIPGAWAAPGAELVQRAFALTPSPDTTIVVNCAGRTRSIIGAQALINSGLPNRVYALSNGIMAWLLEGYPIAEGASREIPPAGPEAAAKALEASQRIAARFGVTRIDAATLRRFEAEAETRSLYRIDIRREEEFLAGHLPGSVWVPGGQLVQGIDRSIAVRNARIVLIDTGDAVRATVTASWLIQIGWGEVFVLPVDFAAPSLQGTLRTGPATVPPALPVPAVAEISPADLRAAIDAGRATVLSLENSLHHKLGHVPGARFAIRARLKDSHARIGGSGEIVIAASDRDYAALAAVELTRLTGRAVRLLAGGTAAWAAAGYPLETGPGETLDPINEDMRLNSYQADTDDRFATFREHLEWEIALAGQIDRDPSLSFRLFPVSTD